MGDNASGGDLKKGSIFVFGTVKTMSIIPSQDLRVDKDNLFIFS